MDGRPEAPRKAPFLRGARNVLRGLGLCGEPGGEECGPFFLIRSARLVSRAAEGIHRRKPPASLQQSEVECSPGSEMGENPACKWVNGSELVSLFTRPLCAWNGGAEETELRSPRRAWRLRARHRGWTKGKMAFSSLGMLRLRHGTPA